MTSLPSTGEILVTGGSPGKGAHGPQGEAGSASVPRSGEDVDVFYSFLHLTQWRL